MKTQKSYNGTFLYFDYPINQKSRYGFGKPPHPKLYEIINRGRETYKTYLNTFLQYQENLLKLANKSIKEHSPEPSLFNPWLPGLDAVSLYSIIRLNKPKLYLEVGSGNSTKFARRAIKDGGLNTKIISIDPQPRAEIDLICDEVIRKPVENVDIAIFDQLESGDILFVDNSHRIFMNSDATVIFLDIFYKLKPGVIVEFHDIFLPYDYPQKWEKRHYSEQYVLAAYLLAEGSKFDIILPNAFIGYDPYLKAIMSSLWQSPEMTGVNKGGASFWLQMKAAS
ncbi:class I SAM-dependent methyltransferase [Moorena producens JHB]|uniref:Class I SAM-dependent methyltransferase n=1 Tax=Moorena producens (strain JHB) TaxID=1454205 RepID=A0A1D9G5U7_MOOP1|nr:class I SAM-dependent methyltransferase [Moorena producens]AOY82931.1 class I SAM-dependent methyltransferase [Moorena producens JHB]